jgi:hypothetical protein
MGFEVYDFPLGDLKVRRAYVSLSRAAPLSIGKLKVVGGTLYDAQDAAEIRTMWRIIYTVGIYKHKTSTSPIVPQGATETWALFTSGLPVGESLFHLAYADYKRKLILRDIEFNTMQL